MSGRILERVANALTIVVAVVVIVVLARNHFGRQPDPAGDGLVGSRLELPEVNFRAAKRTAVVVLSTDCGFCDSSVPFYRRLAAERVASGRFQTVALFAENQQEALQYLRQHAVALDSVVSKPDIRSTVRGTPTLLILDHGGKVVDAWVGLLDERREKEVLSRLRG